MGGNAGSQQPADLIDSPSNAMILVSNLLNPRTIRIKRALQINTGGRFRPGDHHHNDHSSTQHLYLRIFCEFWRRNFSKYTEHRWR